MTSDHNQLFSSWEVSIQEVIDFLDGVIKDREQDFLDLGTSLRDISSRSRHLSGLAQELTSLTRGDQMSGARQSLEDELADITRYCDVSWGEQSVGLLGGVLERSTSLDQEMDEFKRIVRKLNMLSVTTRIESARLGELGRGFMTLADDVEGLGGKMVGHWQKILDESGNLYALVDQARDRVSSLVNEQKTGTDLILEEVRANLRDFEQIMKDSLSASDDLAARAGHITADIQEMVSSMQFHDITRQIVEHVQQTLEEALELLKSGEDDQATLSQVAGWLNRVCVLQISQMKEAGRSFFEAVENLKARLFSISENVSGMTLALRKSLGVSDSGQENILVLIREKISRIRAAVEDIADQSREMGGIMDTVGTSVSRMSLFVSDIEEIGSEIELIALNASIRAAHTGSEGMALGVIAVAIQQLSGTARENTDTLTENLGRISSDAVNLQGLTAKAVDFSGFKRLTAKIDSTLAELDGLNNGIQSRLDQVIAQGDDLASIIDSLAGGLGFHHDVSRGFDRAMDLLENVAGQTGLRAGPETEEADWPESLKKMFERYTMESQRLIHKVQLDGSQQAEEVLFDGQGEDLGDNFELF